MTQTPRTLTDAELTEGEVLCNKEAITSWGKSKGGVCGTAGRTYRITPQFTDRGHMSEQSADVILWLAHNAAALFATIRELRAENERLKTAFETAGKLSRDQLAESERLRNNLLKHGDHTPSCTRRKTQDIMADCDCGWQVTQGDALIEQEAPDAN